MKKSFDEANKKEKDTDSQLKALKDRNEQLQIQIDDFARKIDSLSLSLKQTDQNYSNTKQELE